MKDNVDDDYIGVEAIDSRRIHKIWANSVELPILPSAQLVSE